MRPALATAAALILLAAPAAAEPDLSGFWAPAFAQPEADPAMIAKLPPNTVVIEDTGAAEFPRMEFGGLRLTPEALARAEAWRPEDEMTLQRVCQPPSIVYSVQGPFPFEIDQTDDLIAFRYEYYDPNADSSELHGGRIVPTRNTVKTLSPVVGLQLPARARLVVEYDIIRDHLARDTQGVPTDFRNDTWTFRLQVNL